MVRLKGKREDLEPRRRAEGGLLLIRIMLSVALAEGHTSVVQPSQTQVEISETSAPPWEGASQP